MTRLDEDVIRVEAILKIKTALAFPCPLSVKVPPPVIENVPAAESYVPSVRVAPAKSVAIVEVVVRPAASL